MTRPLYIFDLDGTLALIDHRRPILEDTSISKDERWRRFYAACVDDVPNKPVVSHFKLLCKAEVEDPELCSEYEYITKEAADVWIWSGRSDEVRAETEKWLENLGIFSKSLVSAKFRADEDPHFYEELRMRPAGDYQSDVTLKKSWLDGMSPEDRARLVLVVDDRQKVVDMWRENNVTCLQCAPGNF